MTPLAIPAGTTYCGAAASVASVCVYVQEAVMQRPAGALFVAGATSGLPIVTAATAAEAGHRERLQLTPAMRRPRGRIRI